MSNPYGLSIDIRGEWSFVQAKKIIEALHDELVERHLILYVLDMSNFDNPRRAVICTRCACCGEPSWYIPETPES